MLLKELRQEVYEMHMGLVKNSLVTMTSGNVSGRDFKTNLVVIKPSGVLYDNLTPEKLVVVDLNGKIVEGKLQPSIDTITHLYVYRHMPEVGGVIHTHSNYATCFAMLGKKIPVYLTAIADEFGVEIPVGKLALIGGEGIGQEIVRSIGKCPAILMQNHGVFTIGKNPFSALKAAVMVEDVAKTVYLGLMLGKPKVLPQKMIKALYTQYHTRYGQK